ncbi:MAG TPA: hypothetical protein PK668_11300 [Myxococcota bacterium]|nr:hypothetical protein [Myxococcota bacterium]HRY93248.1 hypothetical protein [Myxococcota bacterium]HSA20694.1 hypothetical protein [Myxococcota bacterium]
MSEVPIFVGRSHQAQHREAFTLDYACRACGLAAEVALLATGFANAPSRDDALEGAAISSARNARGAVPLLRCPRCGRRDDRAVLRFALVSALQLALGAAPFSALAVLAFHERLGEVGWIFLATGLIASLAIYLRVVHPRWFRVDRRARFYLPDEEGG